MKRETTEFASSGRMFAGTFFEPTDLAERERPVVMVLHGGAGPSAHEHDRATRLAQLGHVAFVPDLFGEKLSTRERGIAVITQLVANPEVFRGRLLDALAFVRGRHGVDPTRAAVVGYCFGGLAALELARSGADIRAAVSFHGGLTTAAPATVGTVKASVLVCMGAADPFVGPEQRSTFEAEMTAAGADWQLHVYGGAVHGFTEQPTTNPRPGIEYDAVADARSWQAMRALLADCLR